MNEMLWHIVKISQSHALTASGILSVDDYARRKDVGKRYCRNRIKSRCRQGFLNENVDYLNFINISVCKVGKVNIIIYYVEDV